MDLKNEIFTTHHTEYSPIYLNGKSDNISNESFPDLLKKLVKTYSENPVKPKGPKKCTPKMNHLYSFIFSHREDKQSKSPDTVTHLEQLIWYSYKLRTLRKFDEANKLNKLIQYLKENGLLSDDSPVQNVLRFLVCLTDNEIKKSRKQLSFPTPWIVTTKEADGSALPVEPLCFNETRLDCAPSRWHYTQFPSRLFKLDDSVLHTPNEELAWREERLEVCQQEPGTDHTFDLFRRENPGSENLLGALVSSRRMKSPVSFDTVLSIPRLPSMPQGYSFIPFVRSREENTQTLLQNKTSHNHEPTPVDEGYVSSHCSENGRSPHGDEGSIWEQVLSMPKIVKRYTYEGVMGHCDSPWEKPFLSEAGPKITQKLLAIEQLHIYTLAPSAESISSLEVIPEPSLCKQILYLLMGLQSQCFMVSKDNTFKIRENICFEGVSPDSVKPHLREFVDCGEQILWLDEFCQHSPLKAEFGSPSTVAFSSFKRAVKSFLFCYRQKVHQMEGETLFLNLKSRSSALRSKVHYVYRLCHEGLDKMWFSDNLNLISCLKKELLRSRNVSNLFLLLSFVHTASKPFLVFVEKWIYEGELWGPDAELLLRPDRAALQSRSRQYWTCGYRLSEGFWERTPEFLRSVLAEIFLCGKTLNLLRICSPQSLLLTKMSEEHPQVLMCSTFDHVVATKRRCEKYSQEMLREASRHLMDLNRLDEEEAEREAQLTQIAAQKHLQYLQSFRDNQKWKKQLENEKKRAAFQNLKEETEKAQTWKRKAEELEEIEEEKIKIEQKKIEIEREKAEMQQRATMMSLFQKKMESLEAAEEAARTELLSAMRRSPLGSLREKEDRDEGGENGAEADNESVSVMSTTSDSGSEVPPDIDDPKVEGDTVNEVTTTLSNLVHIEPNNNSEDCATPTTREAVVTTTTLETALSIADELNRNILQESHGGVGFPTSQTTIKGSDVSAPASQCDHVTESPLVNDPTAIETGPSSGDLALETRRDCKHDKRKSDSSDTHEETASIKATQMSLKLTTDENENPEGVAMIESKTGSSTEVFRMRKSKSESSSLVDSGKRNAAYKMSQRMSLFDLKESDDPVLIDNVGGEVLKRRGRNTHGHASDSVIQRLLTRHSANTPPAKDLPTPTSFDKGEIESLADASIPPVASYLIDFQGKGKLFDVKSFVARGKLSSTDDDGENDTEARDMPPPSQLSFAPTYFVRGLQEHLAVQSSMVNRALLSHILVERNLLQHFEALKNFLLFHDAAFANTLIQNLLQKFPPGCHHSLMTSPAELNGILNEAIGASSSSKSPFISNLTFVVKNSLHDVALRPLDFIELGYMVEWPICLIVDDKALAAYGALSKFLSRLRQVMVAIEDVFKYTTTARPSNSRSSDKFQLHRLHVWRHEVQQFVRVFSGYVSHQAIEGSWWVFQRNLRRVSTFDELYESHKHFIDSVRERCFLTPDTAFIQGSIEELFGDVLLFQNLSKNCVCQEAFPASSSQLLGAIEELMERFRPLIKRLNKALQILLRRTRQNHVEDLVLQLTYSDTVQEDSSVL